MRSSINLATRPFINYRRFAVTAGLLAALALGLTGLVGVEGVSAGRERSRAQAHLHELEAQRARLVAEQAQLESELQAPAARELLERTRFLNQLIRRKSLSWTGLFSDLQERLPSGVRILALSRSLSEEGQVQVELRVAGQSALAVIEFLRALEEDRKFRDVVLHSQSREAGNGPDVILAQVSATYAPE